MLISARPVLEAARDAVQEVVEPYDGYQADLVDILTKTLQVLRDEPSDRAQRRSAEQLIKQFASEVSEKLGELP